MTWCACDYMQYSYLQNTKKKTGDFLPWFYFSGMSLVNSMVNSPDLAYFGRCCRNLQPDSEASSTPYKMLPADSEDVVRIPLSLAYYLMR